MVPLLSPSFLETSVSSFNFIILVTIVHCRSISSRKLEIGFVVIVKNQVNFQNPVKFKQKMGIDYYGILQVNRNSTELEIKKA